VDCVLWVDVLIDAVLCDTFMVFWSADSGEQELFYGDVGDHWVFWVSLWCVLFIHWSVRRVFWVSAFWSGVVKFGDQKLVLGTLSQGKLVGIDDQKLLVVFRWSGLVGIGVVDVFLRFW
jgi:hypothetical protein